MHHVTLDYLFAYRGSISGVWSAGFSATANSNFALSDTVDSGHACANTTRSDGYTCSGRSRTRAASGHASAVEAVNVPADQIQLISTEAVQWPDGCLGIVRINARCMGGPVEGFRIILEANGQEYEFHTNQDGTAVAQLAAVVK
jgi:hypothetical protein